ncbi:MAG: TonB-dependent receptor plug domain-containing protein [Planctomycetales bacterium]
MSRPIRPFVFLLLLSLPAATGQELDDPPVRPATWRSQDDPPRSQDDQPPTREDGGQGASRDELEDILRLGLGELTRVNVGSELAVEVTTVSRSQSTVGKSPAAVFVVTNEMIRRSAARTLPEVLRMVPGLNVQRINGTRWAISIRGFTGRFANKLLVQIDGRNVYSPLFGGTIWDEQDVLLEDVDRIEVIRGPGASVWGENAVNGVINVITKNAKDTQGTYLNVGAGDEWQGFTSARAGGKAGDHLHYRVYGKWQERDSELSPVPPAKDDFRMARGGTRLDWKPTCSDAITVQGEAYGGDSGGQTALAVPFPPFGIIADQTEKLSGGFALTRWVHQVDRDNRWALQMYYDRANRAAPFTGLDTTRDVIDLDFQYETVLGEWHSIVWGFGYRYYDDNADNSLQVQFVPEKRSLDLFSYFIQDRMTLVEDRWYFTLGSKFGHNEYTDFEMQPTARLLWTPNDRTTVWGAASYSV